MFCTFLNAIIVDQHANGCFFNLDLPKILDFVSFKAKEMSYQDGHPTNQNFPSRIEIFDCLLKQTNDFVDKA
jgi:hypothetical protein